MSLAELYIDGCRYGDNSRLHLPTDEYCVKDLTVTIETGMLYVGDELVIGDEYNNGDAFGTITFEKPYTPPTPGIGGTEYVVNLVVTEYNLAYNSDGVTLLARMGLDLSTLDIPAGTTTLVILLPDNWQGIKITHIDFVRISDEYGVYNHSYRIRVVIPDGVKSIGMDFEYGTQPFCDGIIHELVIPESVESIHPDAFRLGEEWWGRPVDTIYCVAAQKPESWADDWLKSQYTYVVWGYTAE